MLAHLAHRLTSRKEDLATEALAFILNESGEARSCLHRLYQVLGVQWSDDLRYRTQVCLGKDARHDLVGFDPRGRTRVIIETKFWAGLTEAQPTGYMNNLRDGDLLLFLAPRARLLTLWDKLKDRMTKQGLKTEQLESPVHVCRIGTSTLALRSWADVLDPMLLQAGGLAAESQHDVAQLKGLCDQMDNEAFQPLAEDELMPAVGRRVLQYGALVEEIILALQREGKKNGKMFAMKGTTAGNLWFGRNLRLSGHSCCLYFSAWRWSMWDSSPIWLSIKGPDGRPCPWLAPVLRRLDEDLKEERGILYMPIRLARGIESEDLVSDATTKIWDVHDCLAKSGGGVEATSTGGEVAEIHDESDGELRM